MGSLRSDSLTALFLRRGKVSRPNTSSVAFDQLRRRLTAGEGPRNGSPYQIRIEQQIV
jgi:hypothetical protein